MPHECTNCGRVFDDGSKEMLSGCPNCGGNKFQFRPSSAAESSRSASDPPDSTPDSTPGAATARQEPNDSTSAQPDESTHPTRANEPQSSVSAQPSRRTTDSPNTRDDSDSSRPTLSASSKKWPGQDEQSSAPSSSSGNSPDTSPEDDVATDTDAGPQASEPTDDTAVTVDPDAGRINSDGDSIDGEAVDPPEDTAQASARSEVVSPDELAAASKSKSTAERAGSTDDTRPSDADGRVIEPSSDDRPDLDDLRAELNQQFESIKIVAPGEYELNLMELYDRTEYIISLQEDGRYVIEVPDTWDTTPDSSSDS